MGEVFTLNEKQQKAVAKLIDDPRGRYIECPLGKDLILGVKVKVLQGDGQKIGEISLAEALNL